MSYTRRGFLAAVTAGLSAAAVATVRTPMSNANPFGSGSLGAVAQGVVESVPAGSGLIRPDGTLGYVGVTFPRHEEVAGRIRFGFPDGSLGEWISLEPHDAGADVWEGVVDGAGDRGESRGGDGSELVAAPRGATIYEVDAAAGAHATAFDDGRNGRQAHYRLDSTFLGLPIISRAQWGGGDVPETQSSPSFHPAQAITIHHTAVPPGEDRAASIRSIHGYHTKSLGWADIGYHLLIDPEGKIYQGRGGNGTPVFESLPTGNDTPAVISGAHVANFNAGNVGIALLGDFSDTPPTEAALQATIDAVRAIAEAIGLEPTRAIHYQSGGRSRDTDAITGHRQWGNTTCPGDAFYAQLPMIREAAAQGRAPRMRRAPSAGEARGGANAEAAVGAEKIRLQDLLDAAQS